MAKRRSAKGTASGKQQQKAFEGDGFPKQPPKEVCKARDEFQDAMRDAQKARELKGDREVRLIELMKKHGINRVKLDGENKFFEIDATEHVKTRTIPKDQRDAARADD